MCVHVCVHVWCDVQVRRVQLLMFVWVGVCACIGMFVCVCVCVCITVCVCVCLHMHIVHTALYSMLYLNIPPLSHSYNHTISASTYIYYHCKLPPHSAGCSSVSAGCICIYVHLHIQLPPPLITITVQLTLEQVAGWKALFVAEGSGPSLFDHIWLAWFQLDWKVIHTL